MNELKKRKSPLKLKAKRREKGLTLQELAAASELSAAFLSQAERGKATPSIVSLVSIAKALDTDLHYFITPPAANSLVRRADEPVFIEIDSPISYQRLDADIPNQRMNALIMDIPPDTELPSVHRDVGEDFFYVLEGEVEQSIGDQVFTLKQGDSVHHNTQVDHMVVNKSDRPAKIMWVGTPVIFSNATSNDKQGGE